jgi:uncharacterized OsmC-like protein
MRDVERYKQLFERNRNAIAARPAVGQTSVTTTCRIDPDGLAGELSGDGWTVRIDAPKHEGGDESEPSPGFFLRGGVAACFAMDIVIRAAAYGIPVGKVEVEVQADHDAQGEFGLADVSPGYTALRYIVTVESSAPEDEVIRLVDEIDRFNHMLSVIREPVPVSREVRITAPADV